MIKKNNNINSLIWKPDINNKASIKLSEKHGFKIIDEEKTNYYHGIIMELNLKDNK